MPELELDWSAASVDEDGTLTVPLHGEADDHWLAAFRNVDEEMGFVQGSESPRCRPKLVRGAVEVRHVREGLEAAVRGHVEALIRRANEEAPRGRERDAQQEADMRRHEQERSGSAARMTERFKRNR